MPRLDDIETSRSRSRPSADASPTGAVRLPFASRWARRRSDRSLSDTASSPPPPPPPPGPLATGDRRWGPAVSSDAASIDDDDDDDGDASPPAMPTRPPPPPPPPPASRRNRSSSLLALTSLATFLLSLPYSPPMYSGNGLGLLVRSLEFPIRSSTRASPQSYVIRSLHQLGNGGRGAPATSAAFFAASRAAARTSSCGTVPPSSNARNLSVDSIFACISFTFSKCAASCIFNISSSFAISMRRSVFSLSSSLRTDAFEFGLACFVLSYSASRMRLWYFLRCFGVGGRDSREVDARSFRPAK